MNNDEKQTNSLERKSILSVGVLIAALILVGAWQGKTPKREHCGITRKRKHRTGGSGIIRCVGRPRRTDDCRGGD